MNEHRIHVILTNDFLMKTIPKYLHLAEGEFKSSLSAFSFLIVIGSIFIVPAINTWYYCENSV